MIDSKNQLFFIRDVPFLNLQTLLQILLIAEFIQS